MHTIGLTGSIGAGKSTVARYLEHRGYPIVDADQLGHEAYLPSNACFQDVLSTFGQQVVAEDGTIDRKELGRIVFADSTKLQRLNQIVWPVIEQLAVLRLRRLQRKKHFPIVIFEAAVLIEAAWHTIVNEVWTVLANATNSIQRAKLRDKITEAQLNQRMSAQISTDERVRRSNVVIYNDGTIGDLHSAVDQELIKLHQRINGDN